MTIRNALQKDFDDILRIYARAREYMKRNGNPTQWGENFPPEALINDDIREKRNYVVEADGGIHGVFAFILGDDPTYARIEGAWKSDAPYGTIHRIASDGEVKGVFAAAIAFCKTRNSHLRIDTHADNKTMRYAIEKAGFKKCGIIRVADGTPRIAYELIPEEAEFR
ncbi:N-acetyltransferase [Treponema sp. Marseille-Q4130]|uniref:N-acetyltransferase n=1 Tax=Treponema sp. Marseille-Q4130 TaxID=2766702 RepID=UPI00165207ED|nr:N-acetyltransferase [Treponema sp. Marseille-Q4130]MBC6719683.1 N-acetyltransferase [Treponema sp. Marseille-Q4130]